MQLRLQWTPNPPRSPFVWSPPTVAQARLALHVIADLEAFIDSEPMADKIQASWGEVEATGPGGWTDVEDVVADWRDPDLGSPLVLGSDKAVEVAREVAAGYVRYLTEQAIVTSGRVGLVNRFLDARTQRHPATG